MISFKISIKHIFVFIVLLYTNYCKGQENYFNYYRKLNEADSIYFIAKDYKEGLKRHKELFETFDYVWLDDCIKSFQLSLLNNDEILATFFIKKAIENGLELDKFKYLNQGCTCNFLQDYSYKIDVVEKYLIKHNNILKEYYNLVRPIYIKRINKNILKSINYNHVIDELFKVNDIHKKNSRYFKQRTFNEVLKSNNKFIDSLIKNNIFIGERNLGRYSLQLCNELSINDSSIDSLVLHFKNKFNLTNERSIPTCLESDYFQTNPLFITYHHGSQLGLLEILKPFAFRMIELGFIHPKEYAYLKSIRNDILSKTLLLEPKNLIGDKLIETNKYRLNFYLPSFELDKAKHEYAHKNKIKLFFGFFNSTR